MSTRTPRKRGRPASAATPDRELDRTDRRILALLQEDADRSVAEIGEAVGLSQTPCWKRIKRLEASGLIERRVALLDAAALGLGLTGYVMVKTAQHDDAWLRDFTRAVELIPEIVECHRMAGDVDYLLKIVTTDIRGYDAIYKRLVAQVPLRDVTAVFSMETVKRTTALPIPLDG